LEFLHFVFDFAIFVRYADMIIMRTWIEKTVKTRPFPS
jgi:hypothetical protein